MKQQIKKILLVRVDKIGDLVLSLNADQSPCLSALGSSVETVWMIHTGLGFIAQHSQPKRRFFEVEKKFSWKEFFSTLYWLKSFQPDLVVVLHGPAWINFLLWWSGIPIRVGRLSQWHSYLFFNFGIRQSRKKGEQHESQFNFELVERGFAQVKLEGRSSDQSANSTKDGLQPLKLVAPEINLSPWNLHPNDYVIIHPGMGGSALNWPVSHYHQLIASLVEKNIPVVITGTKSDQLHLHYEKWKQSKGVYWLVDRLNSVQLLGVLSQAKALVAPSTGVLHLAASLGQKCIGIFSSIEVQSPRRWGPKGLHCETLTSPAHPEEAKANPDIAMGLISVQQVLDILQRWEVIP